MASKMHKRPKFKVTVALARLKAGKIPRKCGIVRERREAAEDFAKSVVEFGGFS